MKDDIQGTWEEVIQRNEKEMRDLELRVVRSEHRELRLWKGNSNFMVGKGTAASTERWYLRTPREDIYGDSIDEVFNKAADYGYLELSSWLTEFNER